MRTGFIIGFLVGLFFLSGCSTSQKQAATATVNKGASLIVENSTVARTNVAFGIKALLTEIAKAHPQPAKDSALALSLWAGESLNILTGSIQINSDAWVVLQAALGSKVPVEAKAVADLVNMAAGDVAVVKTPVPLTDLQRAALSIILSGVREGADAFLASVAPAIKGPPATAL